MGDTENKSLVAIAMEAQELAGRLPSADQRELALLVKDLAEHVMRERVSAGTDLSHSPLKTP